MWTIDKVQRFLCLVTNDRISELTDIFHCSYVFVSRWRFQGSFTALLWFSGRNPTFIKGISAALEKKLEKNMMPKAHQAELSHTVHWKDSIRCFLLCGSYSFCTNNEYLFQLLYIPMFSKCSVYNLLCMWYNWCQEKKKYISWILKYCVWLFCMFIVWLCCVVRRTRANWWMLWSMHLICWVSWGPPCFLQRATMSSVSFIVGGFTCLTLH